MKNTDIKVILFDFYNTLLFAKNNQIDDFIINRELLEYALSLKSVYKIHIFTSGSIHTDPKIAPILTPIFDGFFTSTQIQTPKSHPESFKIIANHLNVETRQMVFLDDQEKNVQAAKVAGLRALRYTNNAEVIEKLNQLLGKTQI